MWEWDRDTQRPLKWPSDVLLQTFARNSLLAVSSGFSVLVSSQDGMGWEDLDSYLQTGTAVFQNRGSWFWDTAFPRFSKLDWRYFSPRVESMFSKHQNPGDWRQALIKTCLHVINFHRRGNEIRHHSESNFWSLDIPPNICKSIETEGEGRFEGNGAMINEASYHLPKLDCK